MNRSVYDTKEGIDSMLSSYDDFLELIEARKEAIEARGEELNVFYVKERFWLGGKHERTIIFGILEVDWKPNAVVPQLLRVMTWEEFTNTIYPKHGSLASGHVIHVTDPRPSDHVCPHCNQGWGPDQDPFDYMCVMNFEKKRHICHHTECAQIASKAQEEAYEKAMLAEIHEDLILKLDKTGFDGVVVEIVSVPKCFIQWIELNDYDVSEDEMSYFQVRTDSGQFGVLLAYEYWLLDLTKTGIAMQSLYQELRTIVPRIKEEMDKAPKMFVRFDIKDDDDGEVEAVFAKLYEAMATRQ